MSGSAKAEPNVVSRKSPSERFSVAIAPALLIAVPVAACLGVFFRFGVSQYLDGRLYRGIESNQDEDG